MLRIKELREEKGIKQGELAKELHLTNKAISSYETGLAKPKLETLIEMANYFGCSIDYIIGRESEEGFIIIQHEMQNDENNLLSTFSKLNIQNKKILQQLAEVILSNQKICD